MQEGAALFLPTSAGEIISLALLEGSCDFSKLLCIWVIFKLYNLQPQVHFNLG